MSDDLGADLLALIIPNRRQRVWFRAHLEAERKRGREPPASYWRLLERWERLGPHTDAIAAAMSPQTWHTLEKLLFVATAGDAEKFNDSLGALGQ